MKRYDWAVLAVAAVIAVIDIMINDVVLIGAFFHSKYLWNRFEMEVNQGWVWAGYLVLALFFVRIFTKGYEKDKPGLGQGIRFGILAGLLIYGAPNILCSAVMPLSDTILITCFIKGMAECIAAGVVAGLIYKP
jgi:hypothetical protein